MPIVPSSSIVQIGRILGPLRVQEWLRGTSKNAKRRITTTAPDAKLLEHLVERSLIRVAGCDSSNFLQGLVTNDMSHFDDGAASIYTLFLNTKGRVMYESIIYKSLEKSTYYVECDARIADELQRHLKMYRVRRKVDVRSESRTKVWSAFDPRYAATEADDEDARTTRLKLEGQIFPCDASSNKSTKLLDDVAIYEDPRIAGANLRILSDEKVTKKDIVERLVLDAGANENPSTYREFRYRLGIGEGIDDLPVGKALPLEVNCDYLHGVSFRKGCYIGQELTARTHHTGVVRKRLMPLCIRDCEGKQIDYDDRLVDETGKVVGKFRGREGTFGLGLMRISEALNARTIFVKDCPVTVTKPRWWPKEAQRDKATADRRK